MKPHVIRKFISFLHFWGLVSIPNFYKEQWKNRLHGYYSTCVTVFFVLWEMFFLSSVFLFSINEFGQFLMRFWEALLLITAFAELFYVQYNLTKIFDILTVIEELARDFGHRRSVYQMQRMQKWFQNFVVVSLFSLVTASSFAQTFIPKDEETLLRIHRIYKLKHPQRMVSLPLYIPGLDTSEIYVFSAIFVINTFPIWWSSLMITITATFFFFLAIDIKIYTDILAEYTTLIGERHKNDNGDLIFYTNLVENQFIVLGKNQTRQRVLEIEDNSRVQTMSTVDQVGIITRFEKDKDFYDYFYMKQIIKFQKKLTDLTQKVYEFYHTTLKIRASLAFVMIIAAVLLFLYPTNIPLLSRLQVNAEGLGMVLVFVIFFVSGEMVAACNLTLRSAAYCSGWYKTSNKTRRAVCLFLTRNQNMNYFEIFDVMRLEYDLMVRVFKGAYTCLNLMISQKSKFT